MIRLTKITDYAIILLCQMATHGQETPHNARDLAFQTQLPLPMVSKILKALARGGILISHRGTKGGFRLIRPANQIRISEIIQALEGPIAITECLTAGHSHCGVHACPLRISWNRINEAIQGALDGITLAEMFQSMFPYDGRCAVEKSERMQKFDKADQEIGVPGKNMNALEQNQ